MVYETHYFVKLYFYHFFELLVRCDQHEVITQTIDHVFAGLHLNEVAFLLVIDEIVQQLLSVTQLRQLRYDNTGNFIIHFNIVVWNHLIDDLLNTIISDILVQIVVNVSDPETKELPSPAFRSHLCKYLFLLRYVAHSFCTNHQLLVQFYVMTSFEFLNQMVEVVQAYLIVHLHVQRQLLYDFLIFVYYLHTSFFTFLFLFLIVPLTLKYLASNPVQNQTYCYLNEDFSQIDHF